MPMSVVMSAFGLLPVIAAMADRMGKDYLGIEINPVLIEHEETLAGYRCRLPPLGGLQLWLMATAAEQLFGIGPGEMTDGVKVVEIDRIIDYLATPPEQRSEAECPWGQVPLLP